jgi:CRP-like cAMP-binding protein
MSRALVAMLRNSTDAYKNLWIAQSRENFATEPKDEVVAQHLHYWDAIIRAVDSNNFTELLGMAREAGAYQFSIGLDLARAVHRTVEATNMIEIALLDANPGETASLTVIGEVADLRSMLVMALVSGYDDAVVKAERSKPEGAREQLRAALRKHTSRYAAIELKQGKEIGPLYDDDVRFYVMESGKLRVYNLLPSGRTITLSILSENDAFFQWKARSSGLSCICAEAMQPSKLIGLSEADLIELLGIAPAAVVDVVSNFARRLTESHVLISELMDSSMNLRLYRTLLDLAREFGRASNGGNAILLDVPLTHQRLADMVGSNRVTVTRKLLELQKRGLIAGRGNGSIEILDVEALKDLAASAQS